MSKIFVFVFLVIFTMLSNVKFAQALNPPTLSLLALDKRSGGTKLTWEVTSSNFTCTKSVGWSGTVNYSGYQNVFPTTTTTYSMECTNTAGSSGIKSVTVTSIVNCGWCGDNCINRESGTMCIATAPPAGRSCVFQNGRCESVTNNPGTTVMPTTTLNPSITSGPTITPNPSGTSILSAGDANGDNKVNLVDFSIWKNEYLGKVNTKRADFNNDNKVNLVDFAKWKTVYLLN